ncbi:hypothetical protein P0082_04870 [Candidatus Haliotispira prima]|uniref:Tetratricopeptide repeat-like domain-containing protein n=1 Tax=Candidatus Haliotispira prima TaxID=3034016 RepID=A0ABY8MK63_9SPIO|nr:hypothetical protein P0082_04870 [Candidatus Haliotispira prima]
MSNEQQHPNRQDKEREAGKEFAELVSDFLFRWRRAILIFVVGIVSAIIAWGIYSTVAFGQKQKTALAVYELREAFQEWKDAHPEDLLTAEKNLAKEGRDEQLDIDEETKQEAEETEETLTELVQNGLEGSSKGVRAWAYWVQVLKARHLEDSAAVQTALENLVASKSKTFDKIAKLQLAGVFYSEGQTDEAVNLWRELADAEGPDPEQIVAVVYLGNHFARKGMKEEAIEYWQRVESLGDELLQANNVEDEESFLGGENLIAGNFRNALKQWKAMAENQLLFLQSEKIQISADGYDETIVSEQEETPEAPPGGEGAPQTFSFSTDADGNVSQDSLGPVGLPGAEGLGE